MDEKPKEGPLSEDGLENYILDDSVLDEYLRTFSNDQATPLSPDSSEEFWPEISMDEKALSKDDILVDYILQEYFRTSSNDQATPLSSDSSKGEVSTDEETPLSTDIPDILGEYLCPLSGKIFFDPVRANDGLVYERELIEPYIKNRKNSPITHQLLFKLEEDVVTKLLIEQYLVEHPEHQGYVYLFDHNRKALLEAIKSQDMANIKALLKKDPRLYLQPLENGRNIFQWVCEAVPYGLFSELLTFLCAEKMLDTLDTMKQAKRPDDWKPIRLNEKLQACIMEGKTNLNEIELLLALGAELGSKSPDGKSLLLLAVESKQIEIVKVLMAKGLKCTSEANQARFLYVAIESKERELIDLILQSGVPVDVKNVRGSSALHKAIMTKEIWLIEYLLEKGANPNVPDDQGNTSLHRAVQYKLLDDIVLLLIRRGADYRAFNKTGKRPIDLVNRPGLLAAMDRAHQDRMQAELKESQKFQAKLEASYQNISALEQDVKELKEIVAEGRSLR